MRSKIICDVRRLLSIKRRLILLVMVCITIGVCVLISCKRVIFLWHFVTVPDIVPPLIVLFLLYITVCSLYGVLFSIICNSPVRGKDPLLSSVMSFVFFLFWFPLAFLAGTLILTVLTLTLSVIFLFRAVCGCCEYRFVNTILLVFLVTVMAYFCCIGVSFAVHI